jgi:hypothetical protein
VPSSHFVLFIVSIACTLSISTKIHLQLRSFSNGKWSNADCTLLVWAFAVFCSRKSSTAPFNPQVKRARRKQNSKNACRNAKLWSCPNVKRVRGVVFVEVGDVVNNECRCCRLLVLVLGQAVEEVALDMFWLVGVTTQANPATPRISTILGRQITSTPGDFYWRTQRRGALSYFGTSHHLLPPINGSLV